MDVLDALSLRSMVLDHLKRTKEKAEFEESDSEYSLLGTEEEKERESIKKNGSEIEQVN